LVFASCLFADQGTEHLNFKDVFLKKSPIDKTFVIKWQDGFKAVVELEEFIDSNDSNSGTEEAILIIKEVLEPRDFKQTPMMSIEISGKFPPVEICSSKGESLWKKPLNGKVDAFDTLQMIIPVGAPPKLETALDAFRQFETYGGMLKLSRNEAKEHGYNPLKEPLKSECEKTIGILEKKVALAKQLFQEQPNKKAALIQEIEEICALTKKYEPWFRGLNWASKMLLEKIRHESRQ